MTASPSSGTGGGFRHLAAQPRAATEREREVGGGGRRLLMIAHHFPPASTSGALRALAFARYLSEYGWDVSVVTARARFHASTDPDLLRGVPSHCRVHRAFGFDTKAVLSIRNRYPRLLATPDRDVSWFPHAVVSCLRACRREQPDALLSTSPPVTAHCIGLAVKRITRRPWVVELRDPWDAGVPAGPLVRRFDRGLERYILSAADRVVVTTPGLAADLERRFGTEVGRKIAIVANGYDEEAFARLTPEPGARAPFRIAHIGQCTPTERDPVPFLRAVRRCMDRGELPADTEVRFIGAGPSLAGDLAEDLRRLRLAATVHCRARLSHVEALQIMLDTPLLLVLQNRESDRHSIPAKAYEYLRSGACILAVAPPESATAELLRGFPGVWQAQADAERIAAHLAEAHRRWKEADGQLHFARSIEHYARRSLASDLAKVLDALCPTQQRAERTGW